MSTCILSNCRNGIPERVTFLQKLEFEEVNAIIVKAFVCFALAEMPAKIANTLIVFAGACILKRNVFIHVALSPIVCLTGTFVFGR